MYKKQMIYNEP